MNRTLVIAKKQDEDTSWAEIDLDDYSFLHTLLYVVDNASAWPLIPANKGHEAMVYLTYIIDHYASLQDISIFMHGHSSTWHNNGLLDDSSSRIVPSLSSEAVERAGYINLRCDWQPGCPAHIRPQQMGKDRNKLEQSFMAESFAELYPGTTVPEVLAQPCCAQFAGFRAAIHRQPIDTYLDQRDWLMRTHLDDCISGRIFEYTWQYLFTNCAVLCRKRHVCYCDAFQTQAVRTASVIKHPFVKFARLLFWDGKPLSRKACKESLRNWVLDSKMRSFHERRPETLHRLFESRKYQLLSRVYQAIRWPTLGEVSVSDVQMDKLIITRLGEDIHDFEEVSIILKAIQHCAGVDSVTCPESMCLALDLACTDFKSHQFPDCVVEKTEEGKAFNGLQRRC